MKTIKLFFFLAVLFPFASGANNIYVNEFGTGGAYSTITAAITAASAGDKILIQPIAGGGFYSENLTINKPLELMSTTDTVQWKLNGTVTIQASVSGGVYSIIDMYDMSVSGGITTSSPPSGLPRAVVSILNCNLSGAGIVFSGNYINATVANCTLPGGSISGSYLNAFGNTLTGSGSGITISSEINSNDTLYIVGNIINASTAFSGGYITWSNTSQYAVIMNNFVRSVSSAYSSAITFNNSKSGTGGNSILNNTVLSGDISVTSTSVGVVDNNIVTDANSANNAGIFSITLGSGSEARYNYYEDVSSPVWKGTFPQDPTNTVYTGTIDPGTGKGSKTDNGSPAPQFTDLDLTRNDAGTYGGSYSMANFQPNIGHSRVYIVKTPRVIKQGTQFNINATGYDR